MRLDGIGDALACAPLVAALRDAGHDVGAVLEERSAEAFAPGAFSGVHRLERIPWPRHGSSPASRRAALRELRRARYDIALVASEELEAYRVARAARIRRRVGFVNGWEKPLKTLRVRSLLTRALLRPASARRAREHEVETLFRLGAGLHGEPGPTRTLARLRPLVAGEPLSRHGMVALQAGSKFAGDGLDRTAFVAIARSLVARGRTVVILGDDARFARSVADGAGVPCELGLELPRWKALLAGARAVVTADGGAAHVAGMCGVPCVDLFAAVPSAANDVVRWRPWASPARALVVGIAARGPDELAALVARECDAVLAEASS